MSDEPLFCPFCGAEDYGCTCVLHDDGAPTHGPVAYCEICGVREPCEDCARAREERGGTR